MKKFWSKTEKENKKIETEKEETIMNEEQANVTPEMPQVEVEKGIILFHDKVGALHHQTLGEVSLENLAYYKRYLDQIESRMWDEKINEGGR